MLTNIRYVTCQEAQRNSEKMPINRVQMVFTYDTLSVAGGDSAVCESFRGGASYFSLLSKLSRLFCLLCRCIKRGGYCG